MKPIKNIAIFGAGALGAFYAAQFNRVEQFSTAFVATGRHADTLQRQKMCVNGERASIPVITPVANSEAADLIIAALKHHQLKAALPDIKHIVGPQTLILSVLNGLDSETLISDLYGPEKVLYCIAVGIDAVRQGSDVVVANAGKLIFGEKNNRDISPRVKSVQTALDKAGLAWETPVDMLRTLWWKFMINVGVNQASAVLRAPYGVFQKSRDAREILSTLMLEVIALAKAAGIDLREDDLDEWEQVLVKLGPQAKTSMLQDIEAGRKTEVEIFAGKVVELGKSYNIPTPANTLMLNMLRTLEEKNS